MKLFEISKLAKTESKKAEEALLLFVRRFFPDLDPLRIRINDSKVSLNSVNGFIETPRADYFFKFHTEEGEAQSLGDSEYYQAEQLKSAGLPMISPLYFKTEPGSQFLIYEKITAPTAFDEFGRLDQEFIAKGQYDERAKKNLLKTEKKLLQKQSEVYLGSLKVVPSEEIANAPIHQLFYNRLVGKNGATPRVDLFYTGKDMRLPEGANDQITNFDQLSQLKWTINGREYKESLAELIEAAKKLLNPLSQKDTPVVLGHGDCHNGNKFYIKGQFIFFDPAFAGWQPALLSFVKATVHNSFLHPFWLYEPEALAGKLKLDYSIQGDTITIRHNWETPERSPMRLEILDLQIKKVWRPLLATLKAKGWLPEDWKNYLRKALFCCPFLVYNLIDPSKYTPEQSLLALSKAVELGSECDGKDMATYLISKL